MYLGMLIAMLCMTSPVSLYIVCLVVGGGLLLISTVFGGDADAGVDADFDVDVDADADIDLNTDSGGGALSLSSWFSVQFVVYFAAVFGFVGTVMTYLSEVSAGATLGVAIASGLVVGQAVHQLIRALKRGSSDSSTRTEDYLNKPARVTVAIQPPKRGEVAVRIGDSERFVPARTRRPDDSFKIGEGVVVVAFVGGVAEVVSQTEYEFVTGESHQAGGPVAKE